MIMRKRSRKKAYKPYFKLTKKNITLLITMIAILFGKFYKKEQPRKQSTRYGYELEGVVTRVADGDTFTITIDGENHRIRMYGIDAPESRQRYGRESTDYLSEIILNKKVTIQVMDRDRYNRLIGKTFYQGQDINRVMIESGHAWYYETYAKNETEYRKAQENARRSRRALWSEPNPENPEQFRAKARKSN